MTSKVNNVWVRGIFSLIIGVLLVLYPGTASIYFVMAIGAFFFIPGLITVVARLVNRGVRRVIPFMGLGSLLFGLWLLIMPGFFVRILMYVLGAMLVLAGLNMRFSNATGISTSPPAAISRTSQVPRSASI